MCKFSGLFIACLILSLFFILPSNTFSERALKRIKNSSYPKEDAKTSVKPKTSGSNPHITNSLGMVFVYIKPGTFMMGSPSSEVGRDNYEKQHKVTLTKSFYMQTTEVTQGQWKAIMGENPSWFDNCGDDCPVERVSWNDVQKFIHKLNLQSSGKTYRLPTEAEWEYACRAGTTTPFNTGNCLSTTQANYDGQNTYWRCSKGKDRDKSISVATFKPNVWKLYDMHGNVWEWCQDWYADNYPTGSIVDPVGPDTGKARVIRGGGWDGGEKFARSAFRRRYIPDSHPYGTGFRLVRGQ